MENVSLSGDYYSKLHALTFAFQFIGDAVVLIDRDARICYANDSACKLLGYPYEELLQADYNTFKPYFTKSSWQHYWQLMAKAKNSSFETYELTKSGNNVSLEVVANYIDYQGTAYIVEVMRDTTERLLHHQALLNREIEFRTLAENSPDLVVRFDKDLRRNYTNPAYQQLLNKKLLSDSTLSSDEVWCPTNMTQNEFGAKLQQVISSGVTQNILLEWLDEDGQLICHVVRVVAEYDANGSVVSVLAIGRNISEQRQAELELAQRERYLRTLLDNFPFMVWLKDADSRLLTANTAYAKVAGVATTQELEGCTDFDFFPHYLAQQYVDGDLEAMQSKEPIGTVGSLRDANGDYIWIESYKSPLLVDGVAVGTVGFARDVTQTVQREREYHSLIQNSPNAIVRFDRHGRRVFINNRSAEYYGVAVDFLLGKTCSEFPGGSSAEEFEQHIKEVFEQGKNKSVDLHWDTSDGQHRIIHTLLAPELDATGQIMSVIGMGQDVTENMQNQQRIHHLAYFDSLTDLPNRAMLSDRLNQTIADASRHDQQFGLMMLDLDRFKEINDTLGHAMGDALLCEAARRLEACIRSYDMVSRLGGDEFAILLSDIREADNVSSIASKIVHAFALPFFIGGKELFITSSIGIAIYPADSRQVEDLLKYADSAMYHAKQQGRNNFQFYSSALTVRASERLQLEVALRKALQKEEFELYYQPQVNLESRQVIGAEALIRWNRDGHELTMPDKFIGIAEESGLIVGIGEWVVYQACRDAAEWNVNNAQPIQFAINLSIRQFAQNNLVTSIQCMLIETCCKPEWLKLEITESLLLEDNDRVQGMLQALHDMGLRISIDDFGTGYSALSYLNSFPISQLKIDRSFIKDITTNPERSLIVQAIISLAHNLKKGLVAEGVETLEQAEYLESMGCPLAQGYYFGKPMPYAQLKSQLALPAASGISKKA